MGQGPLECGRHLRCRTATKQPLFSDSAPEVPPPFNLVFSLLQVVRVVPDSDWLVGALSGNLLIGCGEQLVDRFFHLVKRLVLHSGNLGNNQLPGTVKHFLFAKGKAFLKTQEKEVLQDLGDLEDRS